MKFSPKDRNAYAYAMMALIFSTPSEIGPGALGLKNIFLSDDAIFAEYVAHPQGEAKKAFEAVLRIIEEMANRLGHALHVKYGEPNENECVMFVGVRT